MVSSASSGYGTNPISRPNNEDEEIINKEVTLSISKFVNVTEIRSGDRDDLRNECPKQLW